MDFLNINSETESEFRGIAEKLFYEYAIETYNSVYRMTELEFYWNSPTHKDNSTYKRLHVDPKSGDWFFHYSGVDIALKNDITGGYGGIYDINNKKPYKGPMVCAMRLFSESNAFETIKTRIITKKFSQVEIKSSERIGLGQNAIKNEAHKLQYKFCINI
jgi:hypothetical protein